MWTTVWVFSAHSTMNVNWWMCVKSGGNLKDKSAFRTLELYTGSLQLTHWKKYLLWEPFCHELLVRLIIQTFSFCECQYNIHVITGLRGFDKQNKQRTMGDGAVYVVVELNSHRFTQMLPTESIRAMIASFWLTVFKWNRNKCSDKKLLDMKQKVKWVLTKYWC